MHIYRVLEHQCHATPSKYPVLINSFQTANKSFVCTNDEKSPNNRIIFIYFPYYTQQKSSSRQAQKIPRGNPIQAEHFPLQLEIYRLFVED